MKGIKLLFGILITVTLFTSCTDDSYYEEPAISLETLLTDYDLWYIDYNRTTGTGNIPFMSIAYTVSFINGNLYANNNLVGIGTTGNGYGIQIGYYDTFRTTLQMDHDIDGINEFEVIQLSNGDIKLYSQYEDVSYYLTGHQRNNFDYDQLFYDNIEYFLLEYELWEKTYASEEGDLNEFDNENFLTFFYENNLNFLSSVDDIGTDLDLVIWDYEGDYEVSGNLKVLTLDYDLGYIESFEVTVISDRVIELYHISSGTTYQFTGREFIPFKKNSRTKKGKDSVSTEGRKRTKVKGRIKLGEKHLK